MEKASAQRKPKFIVYTVITGDYDELNEPEVVPDAVEYICFTDSHRIKSHAWRVIHIDSVEDPIDINRMIKLRPHRFLPEHEYSLYMDGNVRIIGDVSRVMEKYALSAKVAAPRHPFRKCMYEEAAACIAGGKGNETKIREVMDRYRAIGCPDQLPMFEMHILFRQTFDEEVVSLMEDWWREYNRGPKRDQLSFPFVMWKSGAIVERFAESPRYSSRVFRFSLHTHERSMSPMRKFVLHSRLNQYNSLGCRLVAGVADLAVAIRK